MISHSNTEKAGVMEEELSWKTRTNLVRSAVVRNIKKIGKLLFFEDAWIENW